MIDWWKDKSLTRKSSGEVAVVLVFSNPVGAHNLQEVVIASRRHAVVAVDLRRVVQNAGRLIQEKVRKECPCVYAETRTTQTFRDEDQV